MIVMIKKNESDNNYHCFAETGKSIENVLFSFSFSFSFSSSFLFSSVGVLVLGESYKSINRYIVYILDQTKKISKKISGCYHLKTIRSTMTLIKKRCFVRSKQKPGDNVSGDLGGWYLHFLRTTLFQWYVVRFIKANAKDA